MTIQFTIPVPDDMHLHFRQGAMLKTVVPHTAAQFRRAVVMPNTMPPISSAKQASDYRDEILKAVPEGVHFEPLMVLYLSKKLTPAMIEEAAKHPFIKAVKLYPFGVTTNSQDGIKDLSEVSDTLKAIEDNGLLFLMHGEDSNPQTDVFDREKVFYQDILPGIVKKYPHLKMVCEHITTRIAADFIKSSSNNIGATITPQHLSVDRNAMLGNGMNPHLYCKPILKRSEDLKALTDLVLNNHPRVFAGTDSAPHAKHKKESDCGCAGVYSACNAIELYAEAFDKAGDLEKPETQKCFTDFMARSGAAFYGIGINDDYVTIEKSPTTVSEGFEVEGDEILKPWRAGEEIGWSVK
ncbi:MAG TPA: dihydroorotase [Candidatus Gracilibacteria bacterium]